MQTYWALYGPVLLIPLPLLLYSRGSKQYTGSREDESLFAMAKASLS